jgi:hypothetical protein
MSAFALDTIEPPPAFGPEYPVELGAVVRKFRARARKGLSKLSRAQRRDYGRAVSAAILAKQHNEARSQLAPAAPWPHCASGTPHADGRLIAAAIRDQQRRALLAYPAQARRNRTSDEWRRLYAAAMAEKRAAAATTALPAPAQEHRRCRLKIEWRDARGRVHRRAVDCGHVTRDACLKTLAALNVGTRGLVVSVQEIAP